MEQEWQEEQRAQKLSALEQANFVRVNRGAVRRGLRTGELTVSDALRNPYVTSVRVLDVLEWVPGVGLQQARKALRAAAISEYAYVGRITERQIAVLSEWVA